MNATKITNETQPLTEPVLTNWGWLNAGYLRQGMAVFGDNGKMYNVMDAVFEGNQDVYKVNFTDKTYTKCGAHQRFKVYTYRDRAYNNLSYMGVEAHSVLTAKELSELPLRKQKSYMYSVPLPAPVNMLRQEVPIDPMALGLLLGDGSLKKDIVFCNPERDLKDFFRVYADKQGYKACNFGEGTRSGIRLANCRELKDKLAELNLLGLGSREKFVPNQYMFNNIDVRRYVLSGIVNTDGCIMGHNCIIVSSYSRKMAHNVTELARSLGFKVTIRENDRYSEKSTKKYDYEIEYLVRISGNIGSLVLSMKHSEKYKAAINPVKSISSVEKVGRELSVSFSLDCPNYIGYIRRDYTTALAQSSITWSH